MPGLPQRLAGGSKTLHASPTTVGRVARLEGVEPPTLCFEGSMLYPAELQAQRACDTFKQPQTEKNLVRPSGFEPPRYYYRQPLKLVRLPVPPRPPSKNEKLRAMKRRHSSQQTSYIWRY